MSDPDSPTWKALSFDQMPEEIRREIRAEMPNGSIIREWAIRALEADLGLVFKGGYFTKDEIGLFQKWSAFQLEHGDIFVRRYAHLDFLLYDTLTSKVSRLAQRHCHICYGLQPSEKQFPISIIPIRISPASRQSLNGVDWNAFQAAIAERFRDHAHDFSTTPRLCLKFTFALQSLRHDRDLDNMAKAFQDAFSRALGFNDKHVHHLDILKIIGPFEEEHVLVRVAPSYLNEHSDTLSTSPRVHWGGLPALRLEDFRAPD